MDFLQFWNCLANIINNNRFASLTPGSADLIKDLTHGTEKRKCLDVSAVIIDKSILFIFFYFGKSLASGASILGKIIIAENNGLVLPMVCFLNIFPYTYKIYSLANSK